MTVTHSKTQAERLLTALASNMKIAAQFWGSDCSRHQGQIVGEVKTSDDFLYCTVQTKLSTVPYLLRVYVPGCVLGEDGTTLTVLQPEKPPHSTLGDRTISLLSFA